MKEHAHSHNKADEQQQASKATLENVDRPSPQPIYPATLIQRTEQDLGRLGSRDILQLQRTIGNQAVQSLLVQRTRLQPLQTKQDNTGPDDLIQRMKGEGDIQQRFIRVYMSSQGVQPPVDAYTTTQIGLATTTDDHTTLETTGFSGCVGIVLLGPGNRRTLAHLWGYHFFKPGEWARRNEFRVLAMNADSAHVYHMEEEGPSQEAITAFNLPEATTFHTEKPFTIFVKPGPAIELGDQDIPARAFASRRKKSGKCTIL